MNGRGLGGEHNWQYTCKLSASCIGMGLWVGVVLYWDGTMGGCGTILDWGIYIHVHVHVHVCCLHNCYTCVVLVFNYYYYCSNYCILLVFPLITRRKFSQIDVLEGVNVLTAINGRKNKIRVYYLTWLKQKILKGDEVRTLNNNRVWLHVLPTLSSILLS